MFRAFLVRHQGAHKCVKNYFTQYAHTHKHTHTRVCVCECNYTVSSVRDEPVSCKCMNLNFAFGTPVVSGDVCAVV